MTAMKTRLPQSARTLRHATDPLTVIQGPRAFDAARQLEAIAIPPGEPASKFSWPIVRGRVVHLIESGEIDDERVRATAVTLIHAGARAVRVTRCDLVGKNYTALFLPKRQRRWAA